MALIQVENDKAERLVAQVLRDQQNMLPQLSSWRVL